MGSTVTIGGTPPAAPIVIGDPINPVPGVLVNNSATSNLYLGNDVNVNPNDPLNNSTVPPGQYVSFDGTTDLYGIAAQGQTVSIGTLFGITTAPTSPNVTITGNPTVLISGTVPVSITGTPAVTISGTPNVNVANSPTVNIGTVSGSIDIASVAGNVDVIGAGGTFPPGSIASVFTSLPTNVAAGVMDDLATVNLTSYSSVVLSNLGISNNSSAAGAAVCAIINLIWSDISNNVLATDVLSVLCGFPAIWEIPIKGAQLTIEVQNCGTVGTLDVGAGSILVDGSYRLIPNIRTSNNVKQVGAGAGITGVTVATVSAPLGEINGWVAGMLESFPAVAATFVHFMTLWAGPVAGWFWITPTALASPWTIVDLTYMVQGQAIGTNTYTSGIVFCGTSSVAAGPAPFSLNLPPTQCAVAFKVPATAGNFQLELVGIPT